MMAKIFGREIRGLVFLNEYQVRVFYDDKLEEVIHYQYGNVEFSQDAIPVSFMGGTRQMAGRRKLTIDLQLTKDF